MKSVSFENSELSVMVGQNETVVAVFESDKDQNIEALEKAIAKLDVEWSSTDASVVSVEEAEWESPGERAATLTAKKEGVVVLPSGLQYTVLHEGKGRKPEATDSVKCHYEGKLIDGTVFDSSYRRGEAAIFPLDSVISGWTEGLQLMKEGSVYRFCIPYDLAYGSQGAGQSIPPYAALLFDIELIEVL